MNKLREYMIYCMFLFQRGTAIIFRTMCGTEVTAQLLNTGCVFI